MVSFADAPARVLLAPAKLVQAPASAKTRRICMLLVAPANSITTVGLTWATVHSPVLHPEAYIALAMLVHYIPGLGTNETPIMCMNTYSNCQLCCYRPVCLAGRLWLFRWKRSAVDMDPMALAAGLATCAAQAANSPQRAGEVDR